MRKILYAYIAVWVALILLSPNPPAAWASNPTVTVTKTSTARANLYSISFSTTAATAGTDTAYIFNDASTWFSIDGVGAHPADSLITLECYSSETTAEAFASASFSKYQVQRLQR